MFVSVVALLGTTSSTAQAELASGHRASSSAVRVGTYNVITSAPVRQAERALHRLLRHVDVAGVQEFNGSDRGRILNRLRKRNWRYFKAEGGDPIIYNAHEFSYRSSRGVRLAKSRVVEAPNNPRVLKRQKDNVASVLRLRHKSSGTPVVIINLHALPGTAVEGKPVWKTPRRLQMYIEEIRGVAQLAATEAKNGRVFVTGDWNINYRADVERRYHAFPVRQFGSAGYVSMWKGRDPQTGTWGPRVLIDGIWSASRPRSTDILRDFPESDHRPTVAKYRM